MAPHRKQTRSEQKGGRKASSRDTVSGIPATHFDDPDAFGTDAAQRSSASPSQAEITGATESGEDHGGRLARAARSVRGAISRLIHRGDHETPISTVSEGTQTSAAPKSARVPRRETDIPMEELDRVHLPQQTSLKGSFRDDGRDRQSDQEFASGVSDTRWNDEDRYTNKSGDPRIGTHGRTYEAAERSRDEESE